MRESNEQRIHLRSVFRKRQEDDPIEDVAAVVRCRPAVAHRLARRKDACDVLSAEREKRASQSLLRDVAVKPLVAKTARLSAVTFDRHDQASGPVIREIVWIERGPAGKSTFGKPLPNVMDTQDCPALFGMIRHEPLYAKARRRAWQQGLKFK